MSGQALTVVDDLAARRSAAANKAWETRRLRSGGAPIERTTSGGPAASALAAFEREAASTSPDWYAAALELKRALEARRPQVLTQKVTTAIPAPSWPDYPVDHLSSFKVRNPTIVVTFADGEVVRAPAVSAMNKPVNIGRGLRIAIAFYQARISRRAGRMHTRGRGWHHPDLRPAVPEIVSCVCEETGEIFNPELCTLKSEESRRGQP